MTRQYDPKMVRLAAGPPQSEITQYFYKGSNTDVVFSALAGSRQLVNGTLCEITRIGEFSRPGETPSVGYLIRPISSTPE